MVANVLCYSIYLVVLRPLVRRNPPVVVTAWVFLLSVWCVPIVWWAEDVVPAAAGRAAWGALAFILIFPTVLAYLLNLFALARVRASTVAVYVFLQPLVAGAAGVLVLGEPLRGGVLLAALFILAGVALVLRRE
jgi:drug/metabolite transporter (DMT)-like permease